MPTRIPSNLATAVLFLLTSLLATTAWSFTILATTKSPGAGVTTVLLVADHHVVSRSSRTTRLHAASSSSSLKDASLPLMDSGKAFARSGEFLIDLTTAEDLYGGALSAAGAQMRNAGDCIAQAAASCRFKTGKELVIDELREAGTCLQEAVVKLKLAAEEAVVDGRAGMSETIKSTVSVVQDCSNALEGAGAAIMRQEQGTVVGVKLVQAGSALQALAPLVGALSPERQEAKDSAQRMNFAAEKMIEAGNTLQGDKPKATGKEWLKGGR